MATVDELLEIIHKSKYHDLLDLYQFKIAYKNYENRGGFQDSCSIGFESNMCKLGFHWEATIGVTMIAKTSDWEKAEWMDLESVIAYLQKRPINQTDLVMKQLDKYLPYKEKLVVVLSKLGEEFEPLFDVIVSMFEDEDKIAQWRPALEDYLKEDALRRYGLK